MRGERADRSLWGFTVSVGERWGQEVRVRVMGEGRGEEVRFDPHLPM